MPIITAEGWKATRGFSGTQYDTTLAAIIPRVQRFMEKYVGTRFDSATYTDQAIDGTGTQVCYTRYWPVSTLTAVKIRYDGSTETIASTGYRMETGLDTFGRLVREPQSQRAAVFSTHTGIPIGSGVSPAWPVGRENILVTYTAGYSDETIPVPEEVIRAGYIMLDTDMANMGHSITQTGSAMGNQTVTFRSPADAEAEVRRLLGPLRRSIV